MLHSGYHTHFKKKDMKKILQLLTICLVLTSCEFQKVTDLQDSFEIKVLAEPVLSKLNIKVFNSKDGSDIPVNIDLSFTGAGADQIYTINGTKKFLIENGLITVGVNRNTVVSNETPLTINATITADGYMTKTQEINFDGSDIQEVQMSMMKLDDLPSSTFIKSVTETLVDNKTPKEILIEIPPTNDEDDTIMEVSIPADTEFYDEDGNVMTGGNVTIDLQTFDTTVPSIDELSANVTNPETLAGGFNEFPGSLEIGDFASKTSGYASKTTSSNNSIGSYLSPIGSLYCIYYYINGRRVSGVSRPTTYSFSVSSSVINPNTGQYVKAGDIVSFYRTVNNTNTKIADVPVSTRTSWWGYTYLSFTVTIPAGPGIYPYGFEVTPACNTLSSGVTFKNDGRRTFYQYYVAHKSNPYRSLRWGYMYFDDTYEVTSRNIGYWSNKAIDMLKDDMILTIYYYSIIDRRYKIAYQEEVSKCDLDGKTIDITNTDCFEERDLDLSLDCPDAKYLLNNLYVYYKKDTDRYWSYFDMVSRSRLNGKSPCLDPGTKYQFGFWYGGWKVTPPLTEQEMLNLYQNFDLPTICNAIKDL
jgi:hypothetical protein